MIVWILIILLWQPGRGNPVIGHSGSLSRQVWILTYIYNMLEFNFVKPGIIGNFSDFYRKAQTAG